MMKKIHSVDVKNMSVLRVGCWTYQPARWMHQKSSSKPLVLLRKDTKLFSQQQQQQYHFFRTSALPTLGIHSHTLSGRCFISSRQYSMERTYTKSRFSSGKTNMAWVSGITFASLVAGLTVYAEENDNDKKSSQTNDLEKESNFLERMKEMWGQISNADSKKQLLPDAYPPPYGKKYTIVLSDEILLTRDYVPTAGGVLTKKRPGVEYFLAALAQNYEVVVFTLQPMNPYGMTLERLDPNHHISHRLFVDSTTLSGSKQIKDLNKLNRDLSKVIAIDIDAEGVVPVENLIILPKYDGSNTDKTLLDLLCFFKLLANDQKNDDTRIYVKAFNTNGLQFFKEKWEELRQQFQQKKMEERAQLAGTDEEKSPLHKPKSRLWGF